MLGLELLLGHLVGDYVVQNDWMAGRKGEAGRVGHLACTVHCIAYTLACWAFTFAWMPAWGLAVVFLAHWPIDRFRLAGWWMRNVSGQSFFASPDNRTFPWSIIVVDNIFHLLTLYAVAVVAGAG